MNNGIFLSMLTVLFIWMKLSGQIVWSWWAVLSPIWGPVVVVTILYIFAMICFLGDEQLSGFKLKRRYGLRRFGRKR